jgi:LysM repeat protein
MKKKTWMIFVLCGLLLIGMANLVYGFSAEDNHMEVIVQEGETLWDLASRYHEEAGMSTQELLFYIQRENKLESAVVYPGDPIQIPINQ